MDNLNDPTCKKLGDPHFKFRYHLIIDCMLCLSIIFLIFFKRTVLGSCKSFIPIMVLKAIEASSMFYHLSDYPYYCYISLPWLSFITWKLTVLLETATHPLITFVIINQRFEISKLRTLFFAILFTCFTVIFLALIYNGGWFRVGSTIINLLGCLNLFWSSICIAKTARSHINDWNNCLALIWIYLVTFVPLDTIAHLVIYMVDSRHESYYTIINGILYIDDVAFWLSGTVS
ncbi:hypothetical protein PRIPAC_70973, partial [Pristionchus pacificus]|uniref:Uncharacterized protein n=1 Tax=Pristionchus pacificus TaxID=54126 RepID=A0A2A6C907_PRIPA